MRITNEIDKQIANLDKLNLASSGNSSGSDDSGLQGNDDDSVSPSWRFYVRLSKKQIDKASKDNMSWPGQEEPFQEDGACGGGLERGKL